MPPTFAGLTRHIFYEASVRLVQLEANRRMVKRLRQERPSSFPFISADTFRSLADTVIEDHVVLRRHQHNFRSIVFVDMSELYGGEARFQDSRSLVVLERELSSGRPKPVIIMHNGDKLPAHALMDQIVGRSHHVFASNLPHETRTTTALPVGLENVYRSQNGLLGDFVRFRDNPDMTNRPRLVFSVFNIATNRPVREPLAEELRSSRFGWHPTRINRSQYRSLLLETMFVLSPPGNGTDCHRTWEAIYLGAVPVVLQGSLAPSLVEELPIIAVDSFTDFLRLGDAELREAYWSSVQTTPERAFMAYWVDRIRQEARKVEEGGDRRG